MTLKAETLTIKFLIRPRGYIWKGRLLLLIARLIGFDAALE
jgi:hypothetical protein